MAKKFPSVWQLQLLTDKQLETMTAQFCRRFHKGRPRGCDPRWISIPHRQRCPLRSTHMYAVNVYHDRAALINLCKDLTGIDDVLLAKEINYVRRKLHEVFPGVRTTRSVSGLNVLQHPQYRVALLALVIYRIITGIAHDSGTTTSTNQQSN